jgi:hypothetical protein
MRRRIRVRCCRLIKIKAKEDGETRMLVSLSKVLVVVLTRIIRYSRSPSTHDPLTNSEVCKLFSDFSLIARNLLARGASKAAQSLHPDNEAVARVDGSAPQDQFITEGGRVVGPQRDACSGDQSPWVGTGSCAASIRRM